MKTLLFICLIALSFHVSAYNLIADDYAAQDLLEHKTQSEFVMMENRERQDYLETKQKLDKIDRQMDLDSQIMILRLKKRLAN